MKFKDLLVGKGSLKEKLEMADGVTGVRKSYTCYDIALDPKVFPGMLFKSSLGSTRRYHMKSSKSNLFVRLVAKIDSKYMNAQTL